MPALRRTAALILAVLVGGSLLSGCKYSKALGRQEWVVIFKPGATQQEHREVLAECTGIPHVDPEPIGNPTTPAELAGDVRFEVDKASDADLAKLSGCLGQDKFASFVKSYDPTDFGH